MWIIFSFYHELGSEEAVKEYYNDFTNTNTHAPVNCNNQTTTDEKKYN